MYIFMMFVILLLPLVSQWAVSKFCRMLLGLMFIKLLFRIGLQSFCSDVVVQNVNVISSPTCKVLCFKKHHRVSPIKCFMLETSPFAVIPSTKLPSSSILSPPSSSLSSSSSISTSPSLSSSSSSSSSSALSLNPPSSSSSSVSFYFSLTSEVRVSLSYLNSSVFFLATCFLLFTGFRCNILLTNIYIDLLLLALVFSKNFQKFEKYSKFIMCYNFNYRLVLDLYILFQSFWAVLITLKLGSNFKYQLHCIVACMIIITLNRFLSLKWLINLSSFIFSKLACRTIKNYNKSSWALPINKYDLVKCTSQL